MSRRLIPAVLALLVALTSVGVCARGVQACAAMLAGSHDCCADTATLAAGDCCCPAKAHQDAAFLPAGDLSRAVGFNPLLATPVDLVAPALESGILAPSTPFEARALAPPDTPVLLRTLLLI